MLTYDSKMFFGIIVATVFNTLEITCCTIAYQNDRSGYIVLLSNIAIAYFFLTDTFIFHE